MQKFENTDNIVNIANSIIDEFSLDGQVKKSVSDSYKWLYHDKIEIVVIEVQSKNGNTTHTSVFPFLVDGKTDDEVKEKHQDLYNRDVGKFFSGR